MGDRDLLRLLPKRRTKTLKESAQVAVLSSGGVESCALIAELSGHYAAVHPLYIQTGLFWEKAELYWLKRYCRALGSLSDRIPHMAVRPERIRPLKVLKLPVADLYQEHWSLTGQDVPGFHSTDASVYLPGRNLLLLSKAALYCALNQVSALALGLLKGNPFADSSKAFLEGFEQSASLALGSPLSLLTPYLEVSKEEVLKKGQGLPMKLSFSCIRPVQKQHCGDCNKCAERQRAFRKAGIVDETLYGKSVGFNA